MGRPEPLLPSYCQTLLERSLWALRSSRLDVLVVVLGHEAARFRYAVSMEDVRTVVNDCCREGVRSSIRAGIPALRREAHTALFVQDDMPFLSAPGVERFRVVAALSNGRRLPHLLRPS